MNRDGIIELFLAVATLALLFLAIKYASEWDFFACLVSLMFSSYFSGMRQYHRLKCRISKLEVKYEEI
jgi:hypothetical protein